MKLFKAIMYVLLALAGLLMLTGIASFFLPETSDASILWFKFGRYMFLPVFLAAYSIQVTIENQNLRKQLKGGSK
jgi:hypothetical protein